VGLFCVVSYVIGLEGLGADASDTRFALPVQLMSLSTSTGMKSNQEKGSQHDDSPFYLLGTVVVGFELGCCCTTRGWFTSDSLWLQQTMDLSASWTVVLLPRSPL
jgi:hypothetical protein